MFEGKNLWQLLTPVNLKRLIQVEPKIMEWKTYIIPKLKRGSPLRRYKTVSKTRQPMVNWQRRKQWPRVQSRRLKPSRISPPPLLILQRIHNLRLKFKLGNQSHFSHPKISRQSWENQQRHSILGILIKRRRSKRREQKMRLLQWRRKECRSTQKRLNPLLRSWLHRKRIQLRWARHKPQFHLNQRWCRNKTHLTLVILQWWRLSLNGLEV